MVIYQKIETPFNRAMDGTKKLIAALPVLLLALQEGRLVIIDELDVKLHPKLLRYVISMFKNPKLNRQGAQLLFTSHDMTTMKNTLPFRAFYQVQEKEGGCLCHIFTHFRAGCIIPAFTRTCYGSFPLR